MASNRPANHSFPEAAFISEVFHNLSQPLTALHCTLDMALQNDASLTQLRASVQCALDSAERLRQRLMLVHALNDVRSTDPRLQTTDLAALLCELTEMMTPLFESEGRRLLAQLPCGPLLVRAENARLMRCLLVLLEYFLRYLAKGETLLLSAAGRGDRHAEVRIGGALSLPVGPLDDGDHFCCEVELARRTFFAAGGEFALNSSKTGHAVCLGTLPLVKRLR
jgi:signal transduction histidine kinase